MHMLGYDLPEDDSIVRDEDACAVYDFISANEDDDLYGVPGERGVAGTEIVLEADHEDGSLYQTFAKLEDAGVIERGYAEMSDLAMWEKEEYDTITRRNERLPDGEFDHFYSVDPVFRTTDGMTMGQVMSAFLE